MALIKCPECSKEISDKSKLCIHCGYPLDLIDEEKVCCEESNELIASVDNGTATNAKKKNKKVLLAVWAVVLCLVGALLAYKPVMYSVAMNKMESGAYEAAATIFDSMRDYSEADFYYQECQKHIYADYDFLEALESSILKRQDLVDKNTDYKTLTKTELAFLEEFAEKEFYDKRLKNYAANYIKGLNTQKEALELEYIYYTIKWREGQIERFTALNSLYNNYDLLANDKEFVATYVGETERLKRELAAFEAIYKDVEAQIDALEKAKVVSKKTQIPVQNNTTYEYDLSVTLVYYDKNRDLLDEGTAVVYDIVPNEKITAKVPCPTGWKKATIYFDVENVSNYK